MALVSVGRISAFATCRATPPWSIGVLTCLRTQPPLQRLASSDGCRIFSSRSAARGVKTTTSIKVKDLPQGALPPLPKDESGEVPAKVYSDTLQEHLNNMLKYPGCVLFTRIGDFFELYFDHVEKYAPLLNLKQARKRTTRGYVPMAGFQYWQIEKYLKILVEDHGLSVAIATQVENRCDDGGRLFNRPVTRIVTPGTLIDESFLNSLENNYLLAIHLDGSVAELIDADGGKATASLSRSTKVGLAWVDLSSGEFCVQTSDVTSLPSILARLAPKEVVLESSLQLLGPNIQQQLIGEGAQSLQFHTVVHKASTVTEWISMLESPVLENARNEFTGQELAAGNIVLDYIRDRLKRTDLLLQPPTRYSDDQSMVIDKQSLRGLEIKSLLRDGSFKGSLLHAVRRTVTKSGARLLSQRLVSPSMSLHVINNRLDLVQEMRNYDALREDVMALLRRTSDTSRLVQKFSINRGDADDLLALARTVEVMREVYHILDGHVSTNLDASHGTPHELGCIRDILERLSLDGPGKLANAILTAIDEEGLTRQHTIDTEGRDEVGDMTSEVIDADIKGEATPRLARRSLKSKTASTDLLDMASEDIWIMRSNASQVLEKSHIDLGRLLEAKHQLKMRLRKQLKVETLTLQWSSKLGHHCHIRGKDAKAKFTSLDGTSSLSSTKHTRAFSHDDWTDLGASIDDAKLRIRTEEERVLGKLRNQVIENIMRLRRNAAVLDELDVACSSAINAKESNLVRPKLNNSTSHKIIGGRHPTVDVGLKEQGRPFTSNDCSVGERERIYLITGPNMAGKSTYLRQCALITILAQTGCFVPADYAETGLVDKIFSRVGSADNLYQDQSTFMVEMVETAEILKQATPRSFVIMDEVGRGTTPEDGIAVGYACLHHIQLVNKCRTLFATHFHVLADMTSGFDDLGCYCTDVEEGADGSWMYLHRLRRGVNRQSHALKVARLAGLPEEAVTVAENVLANFVKGEARVEDEGRASMAGVG